MRFLLYTLSGLVMVAICGLVAVLLVVAKYGGDLPDYRQLADYQPKVTTRIHAGDGRLLKEFYTEKRVYVPYDAIPKRVIDAFLAAEDKDFFKHGGVDPVRMAKAMVKDLAHMHSGKRPEGASTITQQVAKNMLLSNEPTMSRKIKEAILAFRIEEAFSKQRILELYLNRIYLGQGTYGVAAAALNYFNKPLDQLTIAQAAYLGELPKAPSSFDPDKRSDAALERRNWVIGRMATDGFITDMEAEAARAEPLEIHHGDETAELHANYFTEEVRKQLAQQFGDEGVYGGGLSVRTTLNPKYQDIAVRALRDGLVAYDQRHGWRGVTGHIATGAGWQARFARYTPPDGSQAWTKALVTQVGKSATLYLPGGKMATLGEAGFKWTHHATAADFLQVGDIVLVEAVADEAPAPRKAAKKGKAAEPEDVAAATAAPAAPVPGGPTHWALRQMPAVSGALVAMDPHTGRVLAMIGGLSASDNEFNRATQAQRQPGSSFKPFVYMAALDKGFTPSTIVDDAPIALSQGPGLPMWRPVNYEHDFLGPQPLRVGIEKSRNAMTVRIAEYIGMPAVVDMATRFGVLDNPPPNYSLAIGSGDTTLLKMVTAYSMIVNGGIGITPTLIDRVQDRTGKTVYRHDTRTCADCADQAWSGQPVPVPTGEAKQVEDPRTAFQMVNIMQGVVQRGTAKALSRLIDQPLAGKTGTTNESKDTWFIGFTPDLAVGVFVGFDKPSSLGKHETGATVAVPIFGAFMKDALVDAPAIPFRIPPGVRMVRVNPATGQPDFAASNAIWEAFIPGNEPGDTDFVLSGAALASKLKERGESMAEGNAATDPSAPSETDAPGTAGPGPYGPNPSGDTGSDEDSDSAAPESGGAMSGGAASGGAAATAIYSPSGASGPAAQDNGAESAQTQPASITPAAPPAVPTSTPSGTAGEGTGGLY